MTPTTLQREVETEKKDRMLDEFNGNWELWVDPVAIMDEIDRLRAALVKYGRHSTPEHHCAHMVHSKNPCDCGLTEALNA